MRTQEALGTCQLSVNESFAVIAVAVSILISFLILTQAHTWHLLHGSDFARRHPELGSGG